MGRERWRSYTQDKSPGWLVPEELSDSWDLVIGDSNYKLPNILEDLERVDMFIHDSEHSYQTMMMEISLSWKKLSKGGYIICDDYKKNNALRDFSKAQNCRIMELGSFGVIKKTSARN